MHSELLVNLATSLATSVVAALVGARIGARRAREQARQALTTTKLVETADVLASHGRAIRDALFARDVCRGCGAGVAAAPLIAIGQAVDVTGDLALLHVRDDDLRDQFHRLLRASEAVRRHDPYLDEPCGELLEQAYTLAALCDRTAEKCLNVVHFGRAVEPPPRGLRVPDRLLTAILNLIDRQSVSTGGDPRAARI